MNNAAATTTVPSLVQIRVGTRVRITERLAAAMREANRIAEDRLAGLLRGGPVVEIVVYADAMRDADIGGAVFVVFDPDGGASCSMSLREVEVMP